MPNRLFRTLLPLLLLVTGLLRAQPRTALVEGQVTDEARRPLSGVSVTLLGRTRGVQSSDSGRFRLTVPTDRPVALVFSYVGYREFQRVIRLNAGEREFLRIMLQPATAALDAVTVADDRARRETGLIRIDAEQSFRLPSVTGGVESLIQTLVGGNNELSSQYQVRGGNFDENLIYINDFEVFRPYLVGNGQQEGLSFINPALVRNVNFYTGGFSAKYGDKMSSVLDIQYQRPAEFRGSVTVSLLEQGFSLGGSAGKGRFRYLMGLRNRSNRNLLASQETTGSYIPSASDLQGLLSYTVSDRVQVELLGIASGSRFTFYPESVKKTSAVFSPLYASSLGLDTYFEGQERDRYRTSLLGLTLNHTPRQSLRLKWLFSRFQNQEQERYDITGAYLFGERDIDNGSPTFGEITEPLGAGAYQLYARNALSVTTWTAAHRGTADIGRHQLSWSLQADLTEIRDQIRQFEYRDSAGYALPYTPGNLSLYSAVDNRTDLRIRRLSGYLMDQLRIRRDHGEYILQYGLRWNGNDLNQEWLWSPRAQVSYKPSGTRDIILKASAGLYHQPPFYRELRAYDGSLNTDVKAQRSWQAVIGADHAFRASGGRPFRLSVEAYYKSLWAVNPYDVDNVRIRYYGNNNANAYSIGAELRLFSELARDAESWLSLGWMNTRENLAGDHYYIYTNAAGEIIGPGTTDPVPADSLRQDIGYLRRPTDRRITAGLFLQDYLSTNRNFKMHLNLLYGSNLPYNLPDNPRYRNALNIDPYLRADLGLSALLLGDKDTRRRHDPFRGLRDVWVSLEIFNLINKANTISYQLIRDYAGKTYAIPNRLTPRLLNLKMRVRF